MSNLSGLIKRLARLLPPLDRLIRERDHLRGQTDRLTRDLDEVKRLLADADQRIRRSNSADSICTDPVFVLACSWRTGSTLVQRILNAHPDFCIWGENKFMDHVVDLAGEIDRRFSQSPQDLTEFRLRPHQFWTANVNPPPDTRPAAVRALLDRLFADPAAALGRPRWGFKEVRARAVPLARLLAECYPDAAFVFLVRDPYATLRSLKGMDFFKADLQNRGDKAIHHFVDVWKSNCADFLDLSGLAGLRHVVVKYEDLVAESRGHPPVIDSICALARIEPTDEMFSALELRLNGGTVGQDLTSAEAALIEDRAGEVVRAWGYGAQTAPKNSEF